MSWSQWGFLVHMRMERYDFLCQPRSKVMDSFALLMGQPSFMREISEGFAGTDKILNFLSKCRFHELTSSMMSAHDGPVQLLALSPFAHSFAGRRAYVFVNNRAEGNAPLKVQGLVGMMRG